MKDIQIKKLIEAEKARQKKVINLIASENYVSKDVLEALGSELTNKYSEGYPGRRYYGGNDIIDKIELIAQDRALKLFDLSMHDWAVNVQPLSGSPANLAVYAALVPVGGKIMGMTLSSGGHLTHAQKVSFTGKVWEQIPYTVNKFSGMLDYAELKNIAVEHSPHIIVAGFTAYPRIVDFKKFREITDACGALLMVDMSHFAGLVAGKQYPSPFEYADVVTTTTHKTLRGPRAAMIFSRHDRRAVSYDKKPGAALPVLIDKAIIPGIQGGPHNNQVAAVAVALREAATPVFKKYASQIIKNAHALSGELIKLGWHVISGGTDTHLILIDVYTTIRMSGKEASALLEKAGIIVNMNAVPHDQRSVIDPSGIRLGTAAETTRGKKEKDMIVIARKIDVVLRTEAK